MPGLYEIRWLSDGRVVRYAGSRGNYYELSETVHLDLHSWPVWCHPCGKISDGENLSSIAEIDEQIRDLNDPSSILYRATRYGTIELLAGGGAAFLEKQLAELKLRRQWRVSRRSPPKCIRCGSADIVEIPHGVPIPNPRGAGYVQLCCVGMCSTDFNEWFFTPEGDRVPHHTRPTYWRHLDLDRPRPRRGLLEWLRSRVERELP